MSNRRSEGTLVKRSDGRWQGQLQVNGVRRTVYAKTKQAARARLRDLAQQAAEVSDLPTPGRRTVGDLLDSWLDAASNLKPSTRAQYRAFADTYVRPILADTGLERVTPDRLQALYASLTPSVADKIHRLLHRAFAVAVLWRWLASNPCDRVLKPAYKSERPAVWSRPELETFLTGTEDHWLHPLWVLLLTTGMRLGEALALRWDDVGLGGVALTITGTLHRLDGQWVRESPKTPAAIRTLVLPPAATDALATQKEQQAGWQEAAGPAWEGESGWVFTGETGKPLYHSTVQHALKRECTRLGLPGVTPHGLRHLHASLLLNEGVPVTAVSARLGHANPNVTMKIYAHALPGQDVQAAQAITRALGTRHEVVEPDAHESTGR